MAGYLHNSYARSLSDHGESVYLPNSGGWILKRRISECASYDAMGIYPLFICKRWNRLQRDLEEIKNDYVCLSLVTDPFGKFEKKALKSSFPDVFFAFKEHYVIDLSQNLGRIISGHHRRNIKKSLKKVVVEKCEPSLSIAVEWIELYRHLIKVHQIEGIPAFSERALSRQLEVPGAQIFRATHQGETISMLVWYVIEDVAYYHLGASNDRGYDFNASFALFWRSIEYFSSRGFSWINLGAGAGIDATSDTGLSRFKKGWSSGTRTAYFCGRIFDIERYKNILIQKKMGASTYFPAYREGEFR
jgi:hypothetical protein